MVNPYVGRSAGVVLPNVLNGLAVAQPHSLDELPEAVGTMQPTPVILCRCGKVDDHGKSHLTPDNQQERGSPAAKPAAHW